MSMPIQPESKQWSLRSSLLLLFALLGIFPATADNIQTPRGKNRHIVKDGVTVQKPWSTYHGLSFFYPGDAMFPCMWTQLLSHLNGEDRIVWYQEPPFRNEGVEEYHSPPASAYVGFSRLKLNGDRAALAALCNQASSICSDPDFRNSVDVSNIFVFIYNKKVNPGRDVQFGLFYNEGWYKGKTLPGSPTVPHKMFIRRQRAVLLDWEFSDKNAGLTIEGSLDLWADRKHSVACENALVDAPECMVAAKSEDVKVVVVPSKEFESFYDRTAGRQWLEISLDGIFRCSFDKEGNRQSIRVP